jgi:1,4-dihydroxy-2-naphthoyl-CoA hydrolase
MSKEEALEKFNLSSKNTLMETLGIVYTDLDFENPMLEGTMSVSPRVHQPMGLLHGGASAAFAESLGSAASAMLVNTKEFAILGIELSCNHLRGKKEGLVSGRATIIHKGRSTHLWEIVIKDELGKIISHCKLTNMIIAHRKS